MRIYLVLFVVLSGLLPKYGHAQTKNRRAGQCTEARCAAAHGAFEAGACGCPDAVICGPAVSLCSSEQYYPGPGLHKNFVQLVREKRDHCGCEPEGPPIQCDLSETFALPQLRLLECALIPTTQNPDDHPGVIPTRLLGLVEAAASPGGNARLPQEQVGQGECIYLQRMQAQCVWSGRNRCDCTREVQARRRIAAANPPAPAVEASPPAPAVEASPPPPEAPPPPRIARGETGPPPTPPPQAEIPAPPGITPAPAVPAEPAPTPAEALPHPVVSGEFVAADEPAPPAPVGSGLVPDRGERHGGGEPPALQQQELQPPPAPPASPFGPPPPQVLWAEPMSPTSDLPPPTSESWMWNRLRLASGFTYYETRKIRTRGGSLEAHLRIAITPLVGLTFGAGAVAGSRSVFVDPVGIAVNPITASPNSEVRITVHWAMLAIHKGQTRSRTPRAEGLGASLIISHAWNLHRHLRFGLAARGNIIAVRHEDALVVQRDTHGLAYGFGALAFFDLGR